VGHFDDSESALFASSTLKFKGDDKPLASAELQTLSETEALHCVTASRYRHVRCMFAATGNFIEVLRRGSLGDLCLP
jgi:16S rRNA pseudouridine516 synthase